MENQYTLGIDEHLGCQKLEFKYINFDNHQHHHANSMHFIWKKMGKIFTIFHRAGTGGGGEGGNPWKNIYIFLILPLADSR